MEPADGQCTQRDSFYKELEMFLGTGIEDFGSQRPNSEKELGQLCCFRVLGFFNALCPCVSGTEMERTLYPLDP